MSVSVLDEAIRQPCTTITIGFCSLLWLWQWNRRINVSSVATSYNQVVKERELWRIVSAVYSHGGLLHVAFNMSTLWQMRTIENKIGTFEYTKITFVLIVMNALVQLAVVWILASKLGRVEYFQRSSVGYSGVVFGCLAFSSIFNPFAMRTLFFMTMPSFAVPFAALFITQLIIWNASFIGHISGILVGYAIGLGAFFWFTDYFFVCIAIWCALLLAYSVKTSSPVSLPFIKLPLEHSQTVTMINGHVSRELQSSEVISSDIV